MLKHGRQNIRGDGEGEVPPPPFPFLPSPPPPPPPLQRRHHRVSLPMALRAALRDGHTRQPGLGCSPSSSQAKEGKGGGLQQCLQWWARGKVKMPSHSIYMVGKFPSALCK